MQLLLYSVHWPHDTSIHAFTQIPTILTLLTQLPQLYSRIASGHFRTCFTNSPWNLSKSMQLIGHHYTLVDYSFLYLFLHSPIILFILPIILNYARWRWNNLEHIIQLTIITQSHEWQSLNKAKKNYYQTIEYNLLAGQVWQNQKPFPMLQMMAGQVLSAWML